MKGNIYTSVGCSCGGNLRHSEDKRAFVCQSCGKVQDIQKVRVKFGREVSKRFLSYQQAYRFLTGLRYETDSGKFDKRDYLKTNPLSVENQVENYLALKEKKVKIRSFKAIKRYVGKAAQQWGDRNIKTISYGDIEDFIYGYGDVSDKTRSNISSALHDFFTWVSKREGIPVPDFPEIKFELGWRNIISLEIQDQILDEIDRICTTPRVAIGIRWLSKYFSIRPGEMLNLKERDINVNGYFVIPKPKEKKPKLVPMLPEDIELFNSLTPGFPDLYFFRHLKSLNGAIAGERHGRKLWNNWWKRACSNCGVEGVDMYGGTRHSTTHALTSFYTEAELRDWGTMHGTDKAFARYAQGEKKGKIEIINRLQDLRKERKSAKVIDLENRKKLL